MVSATVETILILVAVTIKTNYCNNVLKNVMMTSPTVTQERVTPHKSTIIKTLRAK
jgi:hypothetical protein